MRSLPAECRSIHSRPKGTAAEFPRPFARRQAFSERTAKGHDHSLGYRVEAALSVLGKPCRPGRIVAFSPDGKTGVEAAGSTRPCGLGYCIREGKPTLFGHAQGIYSIAFAPDGGVGSPAAATRPCACGTSIPANFADFFGAQAARSIRWRSRRWPHGSHRFAGCVAKLWSLDSGREVMNFQG